MLLCVAWCACIWVFTCANSTLRNTHAARAYSSAILAAILVLIALVASFIVNRIDPFEENFQVIIFLSVL